MMILVHMGEDNNQVDTPLGKVSGQHSPCSPHKGSKDMTCGQCVLQLLSNAKLLCNINSEKQTWFGCH